MATRLYVFSRDVHAGGDLYRQSVSVFAGDSASARRLLEKELEGWRGHPAQIESDVEAAYSSDGGWRIHEVELDRPRVVSAVLTR